MLMPTLPGDREMIKRELIRAENKIQEEIEYSRCDGCFKKFSEDELKKFDKDLQRLCPECTEICTWLELIAVNGKILNDLVSNLLSGQIELEVIKEQVKITSGSFKSNILGSY